MIHSAVETAPVGQLPEVKLARWREVDAQWIFEHFDQTSSRRTRRCNRLTMPPPGGRTRTTRCQSPPFGSAESAPALLPQHLRISVVVVKGDGVVDAQSVDCLGDVVVVLLELELGGVHANDDQAIVLVPFIPEPSTTDGPHAVDA
jgi:hypothetical protein